MSHVLFTFVQLKGGTNRNIKLTNHFHSLYVGILASEVNQLSNSTQLVTYRYRLLNGPRIQKYLHFHIGIFLLLTQITICIHFHTYSKTLTGSEYMPLTQILSTRTL